LFGAALTILVMMIILEVGFGELAELFEEPLELLGVLLLGAGFVVLFVRLLAPALRPGQIAASR
jgi:hypothetical protein